VADDLGCLEKKPSVLLVVDDRDEPSLLLLVSGTVIAHRNSWERKCFSVHAHFLM
jgi:hypothetical protein